MRIKTLEALAKLQAENTKPFLELFNDGNLSVEIYKPDLIDHQQPHTRDEVYVIVAGSGMFMHKGETYPVSPGDLIHVPAHDEHRFFDFTDDFSTWVLFYGEVKQP